MKNFKIFESKKENGVRIFKIFGLSLYTDKRGRELRKRAFLGETIKIENYLDAKTKTFGKAFEIFGLNIFRTINDNDLFIKTYFLDLLIKKIDVKKSFEKRFFKHFTSHDHIYVLKANIGEICCFLTYCAKSFLKKNKSQKPLFIATQKYHVDLAQTLMPDVPCIYLREIENAVPYLSSKKFILDGKTVFFIFNREHFRNVENTSRPVHYFEAIQSYTGIKKQEITLNIYEPAPETEKSMLSKITETGLDVNNFVFIAPFANSCAEYTVDFWNTLCRNLRKQGFDIFLNLSSKDKNQLEQCGYKTCALSINESVALARKSKQIISLRSGLCELLIHTGVRTNVIYTGFKNKPLSEKISADSVLFSFGLSKLPEVNLDNLKEYNTAEMSKEEILKSILDF